MNSTTNIHDRESLTGEEVKQLNFISSSPSFRFRKHFRQGLRSHIFEILAWKDVIRETRGEVIDGIRWFPRARPKLMLRILRTRFTSLAQALNEVKKYSLILKFLGSGLIARSQEFIVDYSGTGKSEIVLCGLQEYVEGAILDPWNLLGKTPLVNFYRPGSPDDISQKEKTAKALASITAFVKQTRRMIRETGYIPDLAGNGNLILTPGGGIKLVDINNIIRIHQNDTIPLDDKNYPSCDKSVEVLAILEQKILKAKIHRQDPLYGHFISAKRKKKVQKLEEKFYRSLNPTHTF